MAVVLGELYRALVAAGTADDEAQKAAEEVADFQSRLAGTERKVSLLLWMAGLNLVLTLGIAIELLVP